MKVTLLTEIQKTQNGIYGKYTPETNTNEWTPYSNDFFYNHSRFIGCKIEIEFDRLDVINRTVSNNNTSIESIIKDVIYSKNIEVGKKNHGILISFITKTISLTGDGLKLLIEITNCESDC